MRKVAFEIIEEPVYWCKAYIFLRNTENTGTHYTITPYTSLE
jgi:hypothetical protein